MDKLRQTAKWYFLTLVLFFLFSLLGAVLLRLTAFPETKSFFYLLGCMTICCFILGYTIGYCWERAGILCGLGGSAGFLVLVIAAVCAFFGRTIGLDLLTPFYLIPVALGTLGGILGANGKK